MPVPVFSTGEVLTAAAMNAVGLWRVTSCTVSSVGGTAATASNGVVTIGTGNSSVTVSNAFSSSFDNYKILIDVTSNSVSNDSCGIRLRTSGGVDAQTDYIYGFIYVNPSTGAVNGAGSAAGNRYDYAVNMLTTNGGATTLEVLSPFLSKRTKFGNFSPRGDLPGSTSGFHNLANSYAGFTLLPGVGTITSGTIRVYGYNN